MMRLNKFLASAGIGSRRKCDDYIVAGKISINGEVVRTLGTKIDEARDTITFEGTKVTLGQNTIYLILNKPRGIITTAKDEYERNTVLDLIPIDERVFPVGRLDQDTTGLILLTNDGDLANKLMHPKYKFPKTYHVLLDKILHPKDKYHFERGIPLDDNVTAPAKISDIRVIDNCSFIEIILYEGRKRQIRRMFEQLGYAVVSLDRIGYGSLTLTGLKRGEWRYLNKEEINRLKSDE